MYKGKIYPGVYISNINVGGLTDSEMNSKLNSFEKKIKEKGIEVLVQTKEGKEEIVYVPLSKISLTPSLYSNLYAIGRKGNYIEQLVRPISFIFRPYYVETNFFIYDKKDIEDALKKELQKFEDNPRNASIAVSAVTPLSYTIVEEKSGLLFNYENLTTQVEEKILNLDNSSIITKLENFSPTILYKDAENMGGKLPNFINTVEPITLRYSDEISHFKKEWKLTNTIFTPWIELVRSDNNAIIFGLQQELFTQYLKKEISPFIDQAPENAIFSMDGEKVTEFKASKIGQELDIYLLQQNVNNFLKEKQFGNITTSSIEIVVKKIEPQIKTADVNNLGITDIVGVGVSTFKDSHNNRIKNIANAVKKLNGTLIKPNEEFSANHYAGPYTIANGYLPEAVIKGDEIKNEVGGGMCQIGTTLFRMAMNSGMDITQRANHSLVVSYYADPVNGNPGTDATLYEPIHDLKFKNDTGNYLLLQTDIDYKKQQLTFTLWGKPDGRSGSYTHPVVNRWLGVGAPQDIEVDDLPPGVKKCQSAFRGAVASFTYTRTTPGGEKIERVFDSYYRSLPRICRVGKTLTPPCPEGQTCELPPVSLPGTTPTTDQTIVEPVDALGQTIPSA